MAAFKLTAPEPSENELHVQCAQALDRLLAPPAMWCTYPAGHVQLSPGEAARLVRVGLKRSFPDILLFFKGVYGVELKREHGKLSKRRIILTARGTRRELLGQEDVFPLLLQTGAFIDIRIARSLNELLTHLEEWKIPLRGRIAV